MQYLLLKFPTILDTCELLHKKTNNLHMKKQRCRSASQKVHAFVFATQIVQSLFFLNSKFLASSLFLSLYRLVCVGPGQKPKLLVFSREGSCIYGNLPRKSVKILLYRDMVSDKSIIQVLSHYTSLQDGTRLLIYEVTRLTVNVETQEGEGHPIRVEEQVRVGTETRNLSL